MAKIFPGQTPLGTGTLQQYRPLVFSVVVLSIFTNLLMLTGPLFMLQVYDRVLSSRSEETLVALFALVAFLYGFYWLIEFSRTRVMARVAARLQAGLSASTFSGVLERAARKRERGKGGFNDLDVVRQFVSSPILLALFDIPWTPLFIAAIFIFHPMLGWLAVAGGGFLIVVAILNQVLTARLTKSSSQFHGSAAMIARQVEPAADVIRSQGMAEPIQNRWLMAFDGGLKESLRIQDWSGLFTSLTKAFRLFLQSAMLAVGAWLVLQNELTPGAMIAGSILLGRALAPVEVGVSQWPVAQRGMAAWRDLNSLISDYPDQEIKTELPAPKATVSLSGATVLRAGSPTPILRSVSFQLETGEALGVIGKSGAGKTTLARALVGLVQPATGEVRLGGATLDQYASGRLGGYIGYLPQDVQLFDGTIAENIARMALEPDDQRVVEAAKRAMVHDIILALPDGYNTRINGSDAILSGGQKQRLALARALYSDPVLLVLDEPNSALDADGSEALNRVVAEMKAAGKSAIIMTHRPSAITACDKLLVLNEGRVAGFGPRSEVIRALVKNADDVERAMEGAAP